jgi:hypothetical protein
MQPNGEIPRRVLAVLASLRMEAERLWERAPRVSRSIADALISVAECYGLQRELALGYMTRGDTLRYLGSTPRRLTSSRWRAKDTWP